MPFRSGKRSIRNGVSAYSLRGLQNDFSNFPKNGLYSPNHPWVAPFGRFCLWMIKSLSTTGTRIGQVRWIFGEECRFLLPTGWVRIEVSRSSIIRFDFFFRHHIDVSHQSPHVRGCGFVSFPLGTGIDGVIQNMTMEHPFARVVGGESHIGGLGRGQVDRVGGIGMEKAITV